MPGHAYWQNEASYRIDADFDETSELSGDLHGRVHESLARTLREVWVHLSELYREDSIGTRLARPGDRFRSEQITGGFTIDA